MTQWQATRQLQARDGQPVEVSIGVPEQASDGRSWRCAVRITAGKDVKEQFAAGEDAFQALQLALGSIYPDVTELGCVAVSGAQEHGFYRVVPISPLLHDVDGFNRVIDEQLEAFAVDPTADKAAVRDALSRGKNRDGQDTIKS